MTNSNLKDMRLYLIMILLLHLEVTLHVHCVNVPNRAVSLAFVFDTTGSMAGELKQAKNGAAKILNTMLSLKYTPLYNYVLVPFNDPGIGPVFETLNPNEFLNALDNITVSGGDDCPEMSIGGIFKAIEVCLPGSFIYVFTDATAKDFDLTETVLALNQKKGSRVMVLLTGDCGTSNSEGYKAYQRISATSSGQIFVIQKSQVETVLDYVRTDIRPDKVNLVVAESKDGDSSLSVPVDSNLEEVTLSVNGKKPQITLTAQSGKQVDTKTVLQIENALVVKVERPPPGKMQMDIETEGPHTVRVSGQSSKDFVVWVQPKYVVNAKGKEQELITGYSAYMYIAVYVNGTDLRPPAGFSKIELLNINGTFSSEYSLTKNETAPNTFITKTFVPPEGYFYVRVIGTDENDYAISRLMTRAITGLQPEKPKLSMDDTITGCVGSNITLRCEVESLIPYSVTWQRQGIQLGDEVFFSSSASATLEVPEACKLNSGNYVCNATNKAGSVTFTTVLNITSCKIGQQVCDQCSCTPCVSVPCYCPTLKPVVSVPCLMHRQPQNQSSSVKTGATMKKTSKETDASKYSLGGIVGAVIVLVAEAAAFGGYKVVKQVKKRWTRKPKRSYSKPVAMLDMAYGEQ